MFCNHHRMVTGKIQETDQGANLLSIGASAEREIQSDRTDENGHSCMSSTDENHGAQGCALIIRGKRKLKFFNITHCYLSPK